MHWVGRCFVGFSLIIGVAAGVGAVEVNLSTPAGEPLDWSRWLADNGPAAVVLWAPWAPGARAALDGLDELAPVARARGLELVVVVVQEPIEASRDALAGRRVPWLHDRYGRLLKAYRVVEIPRLLVVNRDGELERSGTVSAELLTRSGGP